MELRDYWEIIRRRWWLPAGLALVAFVASLALALLGSAAYRTEMRLAVSTQPTVERSNALYYDPIYYANLSSEYLADDLSEVIQSPQFAADVSEVLNRRVDPAIIADVTRARKTHRLIDVTITTAQRDDGIEIARAMERVINDPARVGHYLRALDAYNGQVSIVKEPVTQRGVSLVGLTSEIALRTLVGLLLGVTLAFVADYLDQRVRSRREVEQLLGLPILGEIPGTPKRREVAA